ncbi:MAG: Hpt domain-containing protein [Planctomycetota bacterium]|jgi:HPt (histidine-containing phosphotransfer) domain-containing protein
MDQTGHNQPPIRSEFAGDADMSELIEYYVSELPEKVKSITECMASNQLDELRRLAHQMKGASGGYGFTPLGEVAGQLEHAIDANDDLQNIQQNVEELIAMCRRVSV